MKHYIDKSALVAEIERILSVFENSDAPVDRLRASTLIALLSFIDTIEVKEVDLKKLGEIARHLIAVKENIEDMRLDSSEWNLLKRIGYPERFKAQKGEL